MRVFRWMFPAVGLLASLALAPATGGAQESDGGEAQRSDACRQSLRYTFSWSLASTCGEALAPRGGSSKGAPLTLDTRPHPGWLALREPGLTQYERDRRAILAMAGPYRTSFEFLETVGYTPDFERARPYQSWGTEYIYVVEDRDDFIQLQHIMVMFVAMDDGEIMGPIVQKHWRQDWQYEKPELLAYAGNEEWKHVQLEAEAIEGTWAQSVYQVDDSPRYEAQGKWEHYPDFSTWISAPTWRPLPRRETTVRDDYDVLEGTNRHTIIHNGWVHEEENYKVVLDANGARAAERPYLAKELGVNRYERITDFDWSAGDQYWQQTGPYWRDVRAVWQQYFDEAPRLRIVEEADGVPLFAALFEQAETLTAGGNYDSAAARASVRDVLDDYIQTPE